MLIVEKESERSQRYGQYSEYMNPTLAIEIQRANKDPGVQTEL
jgi:hypothetical protein